MEFCEFYDINNNMGNLEVMMAKSGEQGGEPNPHESGVELTDEERNFHEEAVRFVEAHRDYLENYARGAVHFEAAPAGLNTFAFNLETNTIYVHGRFYHDRGLSNEKTAFALSHEAEHFLEKKALLSEPDGARKFGRYLRQIKMSKAYGLMDNCVADVRENRAVVAKTSKETADIERDLYKKDLFAEKDFANEPKHVQFCDALLRESRVPDEQCQVSAEVREKLDALRAMKAGEENFFDLLTNPDTPMSLRLSLQDEYIWPVVKELLEKDLEDEEKKGKGKSGEGGGGEGGHTGGEGENKTPEGQGKPVKGGQGREAKPEGRPDPNDIFKGAYERAKRRGLPEAVPADEVGKSFRRWQEANKESPLDRADREHAERIGVAKTDLQRYRNMAKQLGEIRNPETNMSVVEELRNLFRQIRARRIKKVHPPRYPVEEGEELVDPAQLIAEAKAGNLEPKVWESFEIKEKVGKRFGQVQITFIFDRSGSMDENGGAKKIEQQKAGVLGMEALDEANELYDEEKVNMVEPLEILSEVYSFQADGDDGKPMKRMSKEFSEKERIGVMKKLGTVPGGNTTDFVSLEAIGAEVDADPTLRQKIAKGEIKKIVIVFTDGESGDVSRVQAVLKKLREAGIAVAGVGITESGKAVLNTYAPNASLARNAEDLPVTLGGLLKEHLADV